MCASTSCYTLVNWCVYQSYSFISLDLCLLIKSLFAQTELVTNAMNAGLNDVVHFLADYGNKVSVNPLLCIEIYIRNYTCTRMYMDCIVLY